MTNLIDRKPPPISNGKPNPPFLVSEDNGFVVIAYDKGVHMNRFVLHEIITTHT